MIQSLKTLSLALVAVFAPAKAVLITVMVMTMADLVSGLLASKKQQIPITSFGLKRTVLKVLVYEVATLLAFLVGMYLVPEELPIMKMVTGLIGITELKSILENLDIIAGGSFFRSLTDKLQSRLINEDPDKDANDKE